MKEGSPDRELCEVIFKLFSSPQILYSHDNLSRYLHFITLKIPRTLGQILITEGAYFFFFFPFPFSLDLHIFLL